MATLIKSNGEESEVAITSFSQLQHLVGGYVQPIYIGDMVIVCDEEGKIKHKPINGKATEMALAKGALFAGDYIVGDVVFGELDILCT